MGPCKAFVLAAAACAAPASHAQAVLAAGSEIAFVTRQMGVPVEGRFRRFDAQLALDPRRPEAAQVGFVIDTGSATFASAEVEAEIARPTWLHSAKFPQASFRSTAVRAAGTGRYEVQGTLTIKGAAHEVLVPVALAQSGTTGTAVGQFVVKRLQFRIGEAEWSDTTMVADEVLVKFRLSLAGLPPG